jgi:hypothetical protein
LRQFVDGSCDNKMQRLQVSRILDCLLPALPVIALIGMSFLSVKVGKIMITYFLLPSTSQAEAFPP